MFYALLSGNMFYFILLSIACNVSLGITTINISFFFCIYVKFSSILLYSYKKINHKNDPTQLRTSIYFLARYSFGLFTRLSREGTFLHEKTLLSV